MFKASRRLSASLMMWLLLPCFIGHCTSGADGGPRRHALLIGCTRYDNIPLEKHLAGGSNDVKLLRDLLANRFSFAEDGIVMLTEEQEVLYRPTRNNIQREFHRLAKVAQAGDQIVILLAGHGSQQPDDQNDDPGDIERDGRDEIFLPSDAGRWDNPTRRVKNAIVDDELGSWLKEIRRSGASIWLIVDSCHSGTMTRGGLQVRTRSIAPEDLIPKFVLAKADAAAQPLGRPSAPAESEPVDIADDAAGGLVAIFAAQPDEETIEMRLPLEGQDRQWRGLLTYSICQVLQRNRRPLTYRELVQQVHAQYIALDRRYYPTPFLLGGDTDREVLGLRKWPGRSQFRLVKLPDGSLAVNAGALHGVTVGSVYAVYPPAGTPDADKPLGHVRVTANGFAALAASVEPCAFTGQPASRELPADARLTAVFIDYGLAPRAIAVDPLTAAGEPVRKPLHARLASLLKAGCAGAANGTAFRVSDDPLQADWLLRADSPTSPLRYLLPAAGFPGRQLPPAYGPLPEGQAAADWLAERLGRIARAEQLLKVAQLAAQQQADTASGVNVRCEMLRLDGPLDTGGRPCDTGRDVLRAGDWVGFRVSNQGREAVDVSLLFVDSDFGITSFYPLDALTDNRLRRRDRPLLRRGRINTKTTGKEHVIMIAVKARSLDLHTNFRFLAQPSLERTRSVKAANVAALGALLENAVFGAGNTRGMDADVGAEYAVQVFSWRVAGASDSLGN